MGIFEISVDGIHQLKINTNYMGSGFAYFVTHTGFGRGQMTPIKKEEVDGLIDTFLKEAGVSGGRRRGKKSRKASRKARRTRRR